MNDFIDDCLLFGKKEKYFILLGVGGWLSILGIITIITTVITSL